MRALVVGGAGSLGSAVVARLLEDPEAHVTVVDDLSAGRLDRLAAARASGRLALTRLDVADEGLPEVLDRARPSLVAWCAGPRTEDVRAAARTSGPGAAGLLTACARTGVAKVVVAVGSEVLGRPRGAVATERTRTAARSVPGAAQAAVLGWARALRAEHALPVTALVLGQTYGPGRRGGWVAAAVAALREGAAVPPLPARLDLVHLRDAADAVVRAGADLADGRRLLVGGGAVPAAELLEALGAACGTQPRQGPGTAEQGWVLDLGGARRALGWEPATDLRAGLRDYVLSAS